MRAAPAVRVHTRRAGAWRLAQAALFGLAAAAAAAWVLAHADHSLWPTLPLGLFAALIAWRRIAPSAVDLAWDGQAWSADGEAGTLSVMLDLGPWMLLRLRPQDGARPAVWVPVGAAECGSAWHRLRAAAHTAAEPARAGAG